MLDDIKLLSTRRFVEIRASLDFIRSVSPPPPNPEPNAILISKGLFFVHLYGAYEYSVQKAVSKSIEIINAHAPNLNDCKPVLFSMALNPQLDAIADVSAKKWQKRWDLFSNFNLNPQVKIQEELFPTNGRNLSPNQLQSIWNCFCIARPILPRIELTGRIKELVNNRNAIAHGTSSAIQIGSLNTISELYNRYGELSEICEYIIDVLDQYLENKEYLRSHTR